MPACQLSNIDATSTKVLGVLLSVQKARHALVLRHQSREESLLPCLVAPSSEHWSQVTLPTSLVVAALYKSVAVFGLLVLSSPALPRTLAC